jgi:hypothetical protein
MTLSLSQVFNAQPGWYRGDFHCHTHHSDGVLSPAELLALAQAEGLDFFTITDHNTVGAYDHFGSELLVIPGLEVTYKRGHYNVLGVDARHLDWLQQSAWPVMPERPAEADVYPTMNELLKATSARGALNSINHPLLVPWAWEFPDTDLRQVNCLEIWNDPSWPDNQRDNPRAIALWTALLEAGYRITAIGGSDFHRPAPKAGENKPAERLGKPSTYVYAHELSGQAILEAVRQRRAYVSMGPLAAFQALAEGTTYDIGADLGQWDGEVELTAQVWACPEPARALLMKNGRLLAESAVSGDGAEIRMKDRVLADQPAWYRFDVLTRDGQMLALTNPIFTGPARTPAQVRFGDFAA